MVSEVFLVLALALLAWLGRGAGARPAFKWVLRAFRNGLALFFAGFSWPLGPEDRVVRRQPWVTFAIIGLCVAVFQLQLILEPGPGWRRECDSAWKEVVAYAGERPYLRVPPEFAGAVGRERARRRAGADAAKTRPDWVSWSREQAELEERSKRLSALLQQRPLYRWADVPARSTWLTQLRSAFVHGNWMHLVGNMVFLLAFGPYVEDVFGRVLFAVLYLGSELFGPGNPGSYVFCYGASGAISGVMGAFLVRFANRRLALLYLPSLWLPMLRVKVAVPAYGFLLVGLAMDVRGAWLGTPGIGWWAHICGFVFGVVFAGVLRLSRIEERVIDPRIEASLTFRQHPAVLRSFALRTGGRAEAAHRTVEAALGGEPGNMAVLREAYDAAVAAGALDRAGTHATRVVALLGARNDPDHLRETLLFIQEARETLGVALPARFHFAAGDSLERQGQTAPGPPALRGAHRPPRGRDRSAGCRAPGAIASANGPVVAAVCVTLVIVMTNPGPDRRSLAPNGPAHVRTQYRAREQDAETDGLY